MTLEEEFILICIAGLVLDVMSRVPGARVVYTDVEPFAIMVLELATADTPAKPAVEMLIRSFDEISSEEP